MPAPAAPKEPDPSETRVAAVKQVLDTKLAQYGGTWSAPYIDLERGRDVTVNDEKLVAASLVKLYIMLACSTASSMAPSPMTRTWTPC